MRHFTSLVKLNENDDAKSVSFHENTHLHKWHCLNYATCCNAAPYCRNVVRCSGIKAQEQDKCNGRRPVAAALALGNSVRKHRRSKKSRLKQGSPGAAKPPIEVLMMSGSLLPLPNPDACAFAPRVSGSSEQLHCI
jgi:hypothetical protein